MRPSARASAVLVVAVAALVSARSSPGQPGQQRRFGQQGESESFVLRGRVVNGATGKGVAHALVQVYAPGPEAVFSGDDGGFEFTDVPRGTYNVMARKPGFLNEQQLRRWNPGPDATMVGVPQEKDATVKLIPEAVIHGRVLDANQEPIEDVNIEARTWMTQDGVKRLQSAANAMSDDEGRFRLAELPPGTYYLHFLPAGRRRPGNPGLQERDEEEGYGAQFYPGVADAAAAEAIRVTAGAHVGIEQILAKQRVYEISGVVRGGPANGGFGLNLTDATGERVPARTRVNQSTGAFRLQGVPAGTYVLSAMSWSRTGENEQPVNAIIPIHLNADVSGMTILLGHGASVGVELDDERSETAIAEGMTARVSINLISEGMPQFGRSIVYPPPKQDKNAPREFAGLAPGTYRVEAQPYGPGYVAGLRCGSVDLLRDDLVVPAGGALPPIQVTLRDDGGQILVTAVKAGEPVTAMVVLYSEDYPRRSRGGWVQGGGSMSWGLLAPGMYKVVAIENAEDLEFRHPAVMEKYLDHAVEVNLGPGDQKNVRAEVQEFQEAQEKEP